MSSNASNVGSLTDAASSVVVGMAPSTCLRMEPFHRVLRERFKWHRRKPIAQFCAVVRHAERADGLFSFMNGGRWCDSDDSQRYPFDTPLSDYGKEQAINTGQKLKKRADLAGTVIHVVVTSPYARCIQTAAAIVDANPGSRLVIDRSLGEIYGPSIMGPTEPLNPIRPAQDSLKHMTVDEANVEEVRSKFIKTVGRWPIWPEDLRRARLRFASRFLMYMDRGSKAKRNFVLVTHGDCVAGALAMMPSQAGNVITGVDYCGFFVATKSENNTNSTDEFSDDLIEGVDSREAEADSECRSASRTSNLSTDSETQEALPPPPEPCDEWEVETCDIQVRPRVDQRSTKSTMKNLKEWCSSSFLTQNRIEQLLGQVIGRGELGDIELEDINSNFSASTYVFGQSDDESDESRTSPPQSPTSKDLKTLTPDDCAASQGTLTETGLRLGNSTSTELRRSNIAMTPAPPLLSLRLNGQWLRRRACTKLG